MKNHSKTQILMNIVNKKLLKYNTLRTMLDPQDLDDLGLIALIDHKCEVAVSEYLELNRKHKVEKSGLRLVTYKGVAL